MTLPEIRQLCAEVEAFSKAQRWRWKANPVLVYEFADQSDFVDAHAALLEALVGEPYVLGAAMQRKITSHSVEIDCYGITLRLSCKRALVGSPCRETEVIRRKDD